MKRLLSFSVIALGSVLIMQAGCADSTNPFFQAPDFSSVPPMADTTSVEPVVHEGFIYYVIEDGEGPWQLQPRADEEMQIFLTLRTKDGQVLQSTRADERDWPEGATMDDLSEPQGLMEGMIGMREEEHRVIVVYPEMGFQGVGQNSRFFAFRNDTLIYEVELERLVN